MGAFAQQLAQLAGHGNRTMLSAGTAYGNRQAQLSLLDIPRNDKFQQRTHPLAKIRRRRIFKHIVKDLLVQPCLFFQLRHIRGIAQKTHVYHHIRFRRNAVLEPKGAHSDRHIALLIAGAGKKADQIGPEIFGQQSAGVDNQIGTAAYGRKHSALLRQSLLKVHAGDLQRVTAAVFHVPVGQNGVLGV